MNAKYYLEERNCQNRFRQNTQWVLEDTEHRLAVVGGEGHRHWQMNFHVWYVDLPDEDGHSMERGYPQERALAQAVKELAPQILRRMLEISDAEFGEREEQWRQDVADSADLLGMVGLVSTTVAKE